MLILPKLTTNRLLLRPVAIEDADSIFAYSCNPNVARYVTWEPHKTIEDTKSVITGFFFKNYEKGLPEPFAITLLERPDWVIGLIGCRPFDEDPKALEIAYVLAEEHWGKGIMAEACKCTMQFVAQNYPIQKFVGRYSALNPASGRVMEKLGMQYIKSYQGVRKGETETRHFYAIDVRDLK
jgi:ribosomal-protein-alanine N-acetyltransferase